MRGKYVAAMVIALLMVAGCSDTKSKTDDAQGKQAHKTDAAPKVVEVAVAEVVEKDFDHEIVSNGKVSGHSRADLYFEGDGIISGVFVTNGRHVSKGTRLASLDTGKLEAELRKARMALSKAELEYKDAIIGQGYDPDADAGIPEEVKRLAVLRSGYGEAQLEIERINREISESVLKAPFDGVVANLNCKPFNRPDNSKPAMSVIGGGMEVDFKILESELGVVVPGDAVEVTPFSTGEMIKGRVSQINPAVDENGLVQVSAAVPVSGKLFDGMNVRVSVRKNMGRRLVVPKSAVVLRTGRQVVFTLSSDSTRAQWNYVTTGLENMGEYTIMDGLEAGIPVIVSGNIDLAHDAPVKIRK